MESLRRFESQVFVSLVRENLLIIYYAGLIPHTPLSKF